MKEQRKSKIAYRGSCLVKDIVEHATTVRLFNKQTWVNLWDGRFVHISPSGFATTESINILYPQIQTVAKKEVIIARKGNEKATLRYLATPYLIAKRR